MRYNTKCCEDVQYIFYASDSRNCYNFVNIEEKSQSDTLPITESGKDWTWTEQKTVYQPFSFFSQHTAHICLSFHHIIRSKLIFTSTIYYQLS